MKVSLNPALSTNHNKSNYSEKSISRNVTSPIHKAQLPNYQQVDTNLKQYNTHQVSFSGLANEKLLKEIEQLELEKKGLLIETADAVIEAAKARISRFTSWNDSAVYESESKWAHKFATDAQNDYIRGHNKAWQFFHGDGSEQYWNKYNSYIYDWYWKSHNEIEEIGKNIGTDKKIVELANTNETQKQARIKQIDALIEKTKKMIGYQGLQDSINEILSAAGGVKDRIAGYLNEKEDIATKFVQKLAKSKDDPLTDVPGCVILYGPTGTGKTTFLNGIKDQSKDYAEVIDISTILSGGGFKSILDRILKDAKVRYTKTQKRTILLMNDAEKIFAINKTDAQVFGIKLDDADNNMLDAYGNNTDKVAHFKALLDDVSKTPEEGKLDESNKSATTFFITTNYPHLIHPDILSREGKATKIPIGLAKDFNLGEVLRFYFEKMNNVADKIKGFKHNPDYKEAIDGLSGITEKGRENIKIMIENGTVDSLRVDYNNMPYEQIAKHLNPNKTEGAYSNDGLRVISQNAFLDYLEKNPLEDDYRDSFFKVLINTKRDVNPERLQKFNLIDRMLKDVEIDPNDLEQLLKQKQMGMLSEKQNNLLKYHIEKIKSGLSSLNEQEKAGPLNEAQLKRKQTLEDLQRKIDESEKNEAKAEPTGDDDEI